MPSPSFLLWTWTDGHYAQGQDHGGANSGHPSPSPGGQRALASPSVFARPRWGFNTLQRHYGPAQRTIVK